MCVAVHMDEACGCLLRQSETKLMATTAGQTRLHAVLVGIGALVLVNVTDHSIALIIGWLLFGSAVLVLIGTIPDRDD